jgi:hypothetical protein
MLQCRFAAVKSVQSRYLFDGGWPAAANCFSCCCTHTAMSALGGREVRPDSSLHACSHKNVSTCICMQLQGVLFLHETVAERCACHNATSPSYVSSAVRKGLCQQPGATSHASVLLPCTQLGLQLKHREGYHAPWQADESKPWAMTWLHT